MKLKEYKNKYGYESEHKALKSLKYVDGIRICPYCGRIEIPNVAEAYYVPDKRIMKNSDYKKYYYVLDAIIKKQIIIKELTNLDNSEVETIVRELFKLKYICLINGKFKESLNYKDYNETIDGIEWINLGAKQRNERIHMLISTLYNTSIIIKNITTI